jgi:hypothetical protein
MPRTPLEGRHIPTLPEMGSHLKAILIRCLGCHEPWQDTWSMPPNQGSGLCPHAITGE